MNTMPDLAMEIYPETHGYTQPLFSVDMLDELSWPCQFMQSPQSLQYMAMPVPYPTSPGSMSNTLPKQTHSITTQQEPRPRLSSRSPTSNPASTSPSPISPWEGYATVVQHPRKQDRERRKAQNRASQRAYRERKEIQLRGLAADLQETEKCMATAQEENVQLEGQLANMRRQLEAMRKENEALKKRDAAQPRQEEQSDRRKTPQNASTPPLTDDGHEGLSRSNSASLVGTPSDISMTLDFDWEGGLSNSKEPPCIGQDLVDGEISW